MECPKCNSSYVVDWYGDEDKIRDALSGFNEGVGIMVDIFFAAKNAIFGKKKTYKCRQCNHIFYSYR